MKGALAMAAACGGTVAVFVALRLLHLRVRRVVTLPVITTSLAVVALLALSRIDVARYAEASRPLGWWLGPATVALAIPMHRERALLRRHLRAVVVAVVAGAAVSLASVLALGAGLRWSPALVHSIAPKSVTTPIAMPIAERLGGIGAIAAAAVILTGVVGIAVGPRLLDLARIRSPLARGVALGTSAHGIGTARAFEEGPIAGAMSGVAMIVSGIATALLAPWIVRVLG